MTRLLYHQKYGDGEKTVVILHGLFGSSKNWSSVARSLSEKYTVYGLDARNHGQSFHDNEHSVTAMANDLKCLLGSLKIENPVLLGHSMGGLTAMRYALIYPKETAAVIIADIAPRAYHINYTREFAALNTDLSRFGSRREIDVALEAVLPDLAVRQFLQTNIEAVPGGGYRWALNVPVLQQAERRADPQLAEDSAYFGPALFLRSLKENFITEEDLPLIHRYFPAAEVRDFTQGNHWLHITEPGFLPAVKGFLEKLNHPPR